MFLKAAMPFNFSSPEYLSHQVFRTRKNQVSPVSPADMNSPLNLENAVNHSAIEHRSVSSEDIDLNVKVMPKLFDCQK